MHKTVPISLVIASSSFAADANGDLGSVMAGAAVGQGINMIPLFVLAVGIAVFFALVQKNPQKAAVGCGTFAAIAVGLALITWLFDFVARHAFIFILLAVGLCLGALILFMVYSPSTSKIKHNRDYLE